MLVLSRNPGQAVVIRVPAGEAVEIKVTLAAVGRGKCRIGFDAPARVVILRTELEDKPNVDGQPLHRS